MTKSKDINHNLILKCSTAPNSLEEYIQIDFQLKNSKLSAELLNKSNIYSYNVFNKA